MRLRHLTALAVTLTAGWALAGTAVTIGTAGHCEGLTTGYCALGDRAPFIAWDAQNGSTIIESGPVSVQTYDALNAGVVIVVRPIGCIGWEIRGTPGPFGAWHPSQDCGV